MGCRTRLGLRAFEEQDALPRRECIPTLLAAIIAHGANPGSAAMGQSAQGITADMLRHVSQWFLREETIRAANAALVDYHHGLPLSAVWGPDSANTRCPDPTSALSRPGPAVCKEIEGLTGRPVYYYLYRGKARSRSDELSRNRPICGGRWVLKKPLHDKLAFKCDRRKLLSNIAWSFR